MQGLELATDQARAPRLSFEVGPRTVGLDERFLLLGLREALEAALLRERGQARQPRGFRDLFGLDQDQPRRPRPGMPSCRCGELSAHARDRRAHLAQIFVLPFGAEIPIPARAQVDPLDHGPHEREVTRGEFARRVG